MTEEMGSDRPIDAGAGAAPGRPGTCCLAAAGLLLAIFLLLALLLAGVHFAKTTAPQAIARTEVEALTCAIEEYRHDTGRYPGEGAKDDENAFPAVFQAICVAGGKKDPYLRYKENDVLVADGGGFRPASPAEIEDPKVPKYLPDPWGMPYVYRENKSRPPAPNMRRRSSFDLYSTGPDRTDQTVRGIAGSEGDDIGNW